MENWLRKLKKAVERMKNEVERKKAEKKSHEEKRTNLKTRI